MVHDRPARLVEVLLGLYRVALRALPPDFRRVWLEEAVGDVHAIFAEAFARRGARGVLWAAASALGDVARAVPREWWTARRRHENRNPRDRGAGMGEMMMMNMMRELRVAARALARRPAYAATATATLALGIGATVAIFSVVNAVLLRSLPYEDADRLVTINHHAPGLNLPELSNSDGTLNFYGREADFLEGLAAYTNQQRNLVGGTHPERVGVVAATPQLFDVLRVRPALGRTFNPGDAEPGAAPVMLLTHASWVARFGSDPAVLGRTLELDGVSTEIVGVLPEGFAFPNADPVAMVPHWVDPNGTFGRFGTSSVARLAPGVTLEGAQARLEQLQPRLAETYELGDGFMGQAGWRVSILRYQDFIVGDDVSRPLWIVLGTVGFVFLIACANVANLFLVRAESRQKELAVRAAMGAGARTLMVGFMAEALLLGAVGGVLGVLLATVGVDVLVARGPQELPRLSEVAVDGPVLAFAGGLSFLAVLLFGAMPMLRFGVGALAGLLRDGGWASTHGRERHRTRNVLVAAQLALAVILLVGSGLMSRSFQALRAVDAGVDPTDLLTVGMSLGDGVALPEAASFYQRVADQVSALPGVASVGLSTLVPLGGGGANGGSFFIESKPRDEGELPPVAMYKAIGADYLAATRQRLVEGRALTRADWEGGAPVALVNQTFADRYLDGNALGQSIKWDQDGAWATVVGVVADAREVDLRDDPGAWAYLPLLVGDWGYPALDGASLLIRTHPGTTLPEAAVREVVTRLDPSVPVTSFRTMDQIMSEEVAGTSFTMILLGIASGVALFLGSIGLFGVVSYVVAQRTREIGVRVALGAQRSDIRGMVLAQSGRVAGVGIVLGLLGAFALTRLMGAVLYGVSALDPLAFAAAPTILVGVVLMATWIPARKASRVDPVVALRTE